jgi:tetratricopeptide (TPR) repeat protein
VNPGTSVPWWRRHEGPLAWCYVLLVAAALVVTVSWGTGVWHCPIDAGTVIDAYTNYFGGLLSRATALEDSGDVAGAEAAYVRLIRFLPARQSEDRLWPLKSQTMAKLGRLHMNQGNPDQAIPILEQRIAVSPYELGAILDLAGAYDARGNVDAALQWYNRAFYMEPVAPGVAERLCQLQYERGQYRGVIETYQLYDGYLQKTRADLFCAEAGEVFTGSALLASVPVVLDGRVHAYRMELVPRQRRFRFGRTARLRLDPATTTCMLHELVLTLVFGGVRPPLRLGPELEAWGEMRDLAPDAFGRLLATGRNPVLITRAEIDPAALTSATLQIKLSKTMPPGMARAIRESFHSLGLVREEREFVARHGLG